MINKKENMKPLFSPEKDDKDTKKNGSKDEYRPYYLPKGDSDDTKSERRPYYIPRNDKRDTGEKSGSKSSRYYSIMGEDDMEHRRERFLWEDDDHEEAVNRILSSSADEEEEEYSRFRERLSRRKRSCLFQEGSPDISPSVRNAIYKAHAENKLILPDGSLVSKDGFKTRINNNIIVLGTSGGGKTRSAVIPNILAANESMIISDPKGSLYEQYEEYLESFGYRVAKLDLISPEKSDFYNPLQYVNTSDEILRLAHQICFSDSTSSGRYDPFWDKADELLITALIAYLVESVRIGIKSPDNLTIAEMIRLFELIDANEMEESHTCDLDRELEEHKVFYFHKTKTESWAFRQWCKFRQVPDKTFNSILITANAMLATLDTTGMQKMMRKDNMMMDLIGQKPTAIFVEVSDTDRSKDLLANIFYTQTMTELCRIADEQPDHRLKVPVRFILDDFGTTSRIEGFQSMISNIRSRNISAMIVLQSLSQLAHGYSENAHTIVDNCDTLLYMGGNDLETAQYIARRSGKSLKNTLSMPVGMHRQFRRGQDAKLCETVDLSQYAFSAKNAELLKSC